MPDAVTIFPIVELVTRELALFAAFGLLVGGINDLALDWIWITRAVRNFVLGRGEKTQTLAKVPAPIQPGKIAIFIPAWDEAQIIGRMLSE